ncbi:hypothetical protein KsCSTR_43200 [Candidatus Kuenenia stuttgartiensis]|uniref:Uncharacterized protein n=1 Tax=Kuenenia stuttgartiensis TaxID=174633 RepID=A0A6G7GWQ7_KUEST|nr:hypothetical protein KsCSTR_43200 [Candidatus Kuenenia stuttgartiensis]
MFLLRLILKQVQANRYDDNKVTEGVFRKHGD